jgi:hypothetical protein
MKRINKNIKQFYPISAISTIGRLKIIIVKFIFNLIHLFVKNKWNKPLPNFEENPIHFKLRDALYLGYKYYFKPHEQGKERFQPFPFQNIKSNNNKSGLSLHVGGDLMPYEMLLNGNAEGIWDLAGKDFFSADVVMANLESPMDYKQKKGFVPEVMLNDMLFNGSDELMHVFTAANTYKFDVLTLANNHMLDAGWDGLQNTMKMLDSMGVKYLGARNQNGDNNYLIIEEKGIKMGFVNFTYSLNRVVVEKHCENLVNYLELNDLNVDLKPLIEAAADAKNAGAEVLIAYLHMGNAYQCYPSEHIQKQVNRIFNDCSFDVIFISHPHNLQPAEIVPFTCKYSGKQKRGVVYYSLGDYVAYDIFNWSHLTGYAKLQLDRIGDEIVLIPSFEFLYLQREKNGKLKFIPWSLAIKNSMYQDDQFHYLLDWYDKHAKNFY